jgi:hypothetical protein
VQETLDWITFTTEFVKAAGRADREKLDEAAENKMSFTKALGVDLGGRKLDERLWAADGNPHKLSYEHLMKFMAWDDDFWKRMIDMKDRLEKELAALPG